MAPSRDGTYDLGKPDRRWDEVYAMYGYFDGNLYVQGRVVLKDGDPVQTARFIDEAKTDIDAIYSIVVDTDTRLQRVQETLDLLRLYVEEIYMQTRRPETLLPIRLVVGTAPIPLSDVDRVVKRIHVKVPGDSPYFIYLGNENTQDYILEPGDIDVFEITNPRKIYVRSLGEATIFIAFEE